MTEADAIQMITAAVAKVSPNKASMVTAETDLIRDGVLDSLDVMSFLFELESARGAKLDEIDESFEDFRVSRLVQMLTK